MAIKVIPNAHKNEIIGMENEELKIRLAAVPNKGKANEALICFLSNELQIAKSDVVILKGESSRHKKILLKNVFVSPFQG